ncbi:MAG: fatty acid desaturase [Thiobacillaceae bacterium]|nr:fatty acid desaturase [Thiobacillaceae bacterium]MDW8324210.1 fatty acid desaturase [Burkholderiales bacterium]
MHPVIPHHRGLVLNRLLLLLGLLLALTQFVLLPVLLLPQQPAWGWCLLVPVLFTNTGWALLHESMHGVLLSGRRANRLAGRALAIAYGAAFDLLRWGHLLHHALNRTRRERSEVYVAGRDPKLWFTLNYYFRLSGGLYLYEVLGSLIFLLPRPAIRWWERRLARADNVVAALTDKLLHPPTLRAVRQDAALALTLYAAAFALYGGHAWMLALALAARAFLISVVDNVFHYGTPLDDIRYARNLHLPPWLAVALLHFNLHGAHHLRPGLAWWQLPAFHRASGLGYQGNWWPALIAQFRGPIPEHRLLPTKGGRI